MAHTHQANRFSPATQSQPRKFWMRWRVRLGYPVAIIYWLLATPTWRSIAYGTIVAALGLMVRAAAAGYLRKDRELAVTGPYALTRNPLYLGSAILAAGFVVASHSWIAGLLVSLYFGIFYYAVMRNEEEDLRMRFGADFNAYASRVPLFVPNPFASRKPQSPVNSAASGEANGGFSWAQYRRNREYRALLGAIAAMAMVCLRMYIRARFGY
ncbi:MAG: isoprenylcysteine carboxylmethyltransferase family protein [Candidatus Acidiferrales bacterium]